MLAEIRLFSCNFAPKGWALCNGQIMTIGQNQALFSLLGTTYGGDGRTTFALPNLQGRAPVHTGNGINLGQVGGEVAHTLIMNELPAHTHQVKGSSKVALTPTAINNSWAVTAASSYSRQSTLNMGENALHPSAVSSVGGNQPHLNMQPYLTLNFCIALVGVFPSQN
ncbi:tail fiber protein [Paenibacillus sp. RC67]|uniref:phage tail protein n=1 Tax=Paenibacillus sp. RC67 TaxID=3039392 RepID=UPI0032C21F06